MASNYYTFTILMKISFVLLVLTYSALFNRKVHMSMLEYRANLIEYLLTPFSLERLTV
jgi:hypothetical protein